MAKRHVKNFLYPKLTYKVRGCAFRVYNELGFGHKEAVYQKALAIEFDKERIPYKQETAIIILYKGVKTGNYRPDFLVDDKLIVETKSLLVLPANYLRQVMNYLKVLVINLP